MSNIAKMLVLILATLLILPLTTFAAVPDQVILFDQGHGQQFRIEGKGELQLSELAGVFRSGFALVKSDNAALTDENLAGVKGLVISGPFATLKTEEVDAIARFVQRGGRLAVMLHIAAPLSRLLHRLDVDHSNSVLHERNNIISNNDLSFTVKDLAPSPFFNGISQFSAYGVWALNPGASSAGIASTSDQAWVDLNGDKVLSDGDAVGAFNIAVLGSYGAGGFVIFGDDAIFQNRYLDENNRLLARNLAAWLLGQ